VTSSQATSTAVMHNGAPVVKWLPGYYRIADFLGRYTDQSGISAEDAVESFVRNHTCNLLTSYKDHIAWRDAGYPTREQWLALTEPGSRNPSSGRKNCGGVGRKLVPPGSEGRS
jgi:hypothetical protein